MTKRQLHPGMAVWAHRMDGPFMTWLRRWTPKRWFPDRIPCIIEDYPYKHRVFGWVVEYRQANSRGGLMWAEVRLLTRRDT
jgi:hypothetical protein